jgi:hypothetical protein
MPSPSHGHWQSILSGEVHGAHDVGRPGTSGDEGRPSVEHPVPQLAGLVVGIVARTQQLTP